MRTRESRTSKRIFRLNLAQLRIIVLPRPALLIGIAAALGPGGLAQPAAKRLELNQPQNLTAVTSKEPRLWQLTIGDSHFLEIRIRCRNLELDSLLRDPGGRVWTEVGFIRLSAELEKLRWISSAAGNWELELTPTSIAAEGSCEIVWSTERDPTDSDRLLVEADRLGERSRAVRAEDPGEAERLLLQEIDIREQALGPDHLELSVPLDQLGILYLELGRYGQARPLFENSLRIQEEELGPDDLDIAKALNNLALSNEYLGDYEEAGKLYQKALALRKRVQGTENAEVASLLNNLAELERVKGNFAEAEPLYRRALAMREKVLGTDHPDFADSLNNLAVLYDIQGKYREAESLYLRSLEIRGRVLGPDDPKVAGSLNNLGILYFNQGLYSKAEPLFERSLQIKEKALGEDHPELTSPVNNLGYLYFVQGKYAASLPLFRRSVQLLEKALGTEHPDLASGLDNLATVLFTQGNYSEAEALQRRALAIREKTLGTDHADVGGSLHNLANLYVTEGKYAEAQPLYERSQAILEASLGPEHPDVARSLTSLAALHSNQGDHSTAEAEYRRALEIREKVQGTEHPDVAESLNNLANLYTRAGRPAEARPLLERAAKILEQALGPKHPMLAETLQNLAATWSAEGDFIRAQPLSQRALEILLEAHGKDHPDVAVALSEYAELLLAKDPGSLQQVLPMVEGALDILEGSVAYPERRIHSHVQRAVIRRQLGDTTGALEDLKEALDSLEEIRPQIGGGEETRARHFEGYREDYGLMVSWQLEVGDLETALEYADRRKARALLDQLAAGRVDLRASIPPDIRGPLEARETEAKSQLAEYQQRITLLRDRTDLSDEERSRQLLEHEVKLREIQTQYQSIYADIKNASPLWRDLITAGGRTVSLATIQRRIVPTNGLLLFYHLGDVQAHLFVIPPSGSEVKVMRLSIEGQDASHYDLQPGPLKASDLARILAGDSSGQVNSNTIRNLGEFPLLSETLWRILVPEELRPQLLSCPEVVIVPDGFLHLIPFESLVIRDPLGNEGGPRYWIDDGPVVRYAASLSTLYNIEQRPDARIMPVESERGLLTLSDPTYSPSEMAAGRSEPPAVTTPAAPVEAPGARTRSTYERSAGVLRRLPGTARESAAIQDAFQSEHEMTPLVLLQRSDATEEALRKNLVGKRYLHLATHGLVAVAGQTLFSALALAPPTGLTTLAENDGFLQLYEIYGLQVPECELAVLSACETSVGPRLESEGVFSLSRGFLAAGARRVIASQWAVDDESTALLMGHLFRQIAHQERLGERIDFAAALRDAKREVRRQAKWSNPYFWAPFIIIGKR